MADMVATEAPQDAEFAAALEQIKALLQGGQGDETTPDVAVSPPMRERAPVATMGGERPFDIGPTNRLAQSGPSLPPLPLQVSSQALNALQPQTASEFEDLDRDARSMGIILQATGAAPAYRATVAAREGRPIDAAGHAALAMMPFRPVAGLATLGGAYAGALAGDLGAFDMASANAQTRKAPTAVMPGLAPEQQAEYDRARTRLEKGNFGSAAERRQLEETMREIRRVSSDFVTTRNNAGATAEADRNRQAQEEYNRTVLNAENALAEARGRVPRPFKDTNVGRLYEATGGWTPAVVGAGTSALARVVGRSRPEAIVEGTLAGALTPNAPMVWDMFSQPAYNPERTMYSDYGRDLPPTHPRRQEWVDYAQSLPEENPTRRFASQEFYDPWKFAERTGIGALEGLAGSFVGANLADGARTTAGSIRNGLANTFGQRQGTPQPPPGPPSGTPLPNSPIPSAPPAGLLPPPGGSTNRLDPSSLLSSPANSNAQNAGTLPPASPFTFNEGSGRWHGPNGRFVRSRKPPKDE